MLAAMLDPVRVFLAEHVVLAIAIVLFVEELGVPLLIPGDIMMILGGVEVARGNASLAVVVLVGEAATLAGGTILFYLARGVGRPALLRFGQYVGLDRARIAAAEDSLRRYQFRAVFFGRLFPGLRIVIVIAAGLANLEFRRFFPAFALGSLLYLVAYTLLGVVAGEAAIRFVDRLSIPASAFGSLVALGLLALGFRRARSWRLLQRPLRPTALSAATAGVIASVTALLATDAVRGVLVVVGRLREAVPAGAAVDTGRLIGPLLNWPGFVTIAFLLAMLVPALGVRRRTLPVRLILTGLLPFALTLVVVNPVFAGQGLGWHPGIPLTTVLLVGVRWTVFAAMLEYLDELMYAERRQPAAVREVDHARGISPVGPAPGPPPP